ncbi:MAG: HAD family hydrolase [Bacteroidetes bacterium]|nr:MAG: HAD family hydrolase [Bacteroidota bacterium]
MDLTRYSTIIWDWNGTLLDDAWLCVEVMNGMLRKRNLPPITLELYRSIFDFPVKDYYGKLGFEFNREPFEVVGMEFMALYNERQKECSLHPEVKHLLPYCQLKGYKQCILSAREQNELLQETVDLEVRPFFDLVCGLDDHYAHGKTDVGFRLISELGIPRRELIFIGDTLHDAEVAKEIGIDCILIPNGHHSEERIRSAKVQVFSSLTEFVSSI